MDYEKQNKEIKQVFTRLSFTLVLIGLSICLFVLLYISQKRLVTLGEIRYQTELLADQLRQSSDDLTRLVRTYAVTANEKFEKLYWEALAIRNGETPRPLHYDRIYWDFLMVKNGKPPYPVGNAVSLKKLMKEAGFSERELALLAESQKNSDELVLLEKRAMDAVKGKNEILSGDVPKNASDRQMAIELLFGEKYHTSLVNLLSFAVKERTIELEKTNHSLKQKIEDHEKAEQKIKALKGLLPICSSCKKIRDDTGYWNQIESYIQEHSEAEFSHGMCPECVKKNYPEVYKNIAKKIK